MEGWWGASLAVTAVVWICERISVLDLGARQDGKEREEGEERKHDDVPLGVQLSLQVRGHVDLGVGADMQAGAGAGRGDAGEEEAASQGGQ